MTPQYNLSVRTEIAQQAQYLWDAGRNSKVLYSHLAVSAAPLLGSFIVDPVYMLYLF